MYSSRDPYLHSLWHEKDAAYVEAFGSTLQKSAFHEGHGPLDMKRDEVFEQNDVQARELLDTHDVATGGMARKQVKRRILRDL